MESFLHLTVGRTAERGGGEKLFCAIFSFLSSCAFWRRRRRGGEGGGGCSLLFSLWRSLLLLLGRREWHKVKRGGEGRGGLQKHGFSIWRARKKEEEG